MVVAKLESQMKEAIQHLDYEYNLSFTIDEYKEVLRYLGYYKSNLKALNAKVFKMFEEHMDKSKLMLVIAGINNVYVPDLIYSTKVP